MLTPFQSLIILVIVFSVIILPIILILKFSSKRDRKKRTASFENLAEKYQMELTEVEEFNVLFIGYDEKKNTLLFYNIESKEVELVAIRLVENCTVSESKEDGWVKDVSLIIKYTDQKKALITFYKRFGNLTSVNWAVEKAEYWRNRIQNLAKM